MNTHYDVALITVRAGRHGDALAVLRERLAGAADLRACWYSDIGALNRILIIRAQADPAAAIAARLAELEDESPFGLGDLITAMSLDTYVSFDFIAPLAAGDFGPFYEVRTYELNPDGLPPTMALWRKYVPDRAKVSPLIAAMVSVTGTVTRFLHIWPYRSLDERGRLRAKAIADGVWPPPGGPGHLATQQSDIYLPAPFSPMR